MERKPIQRIGDLIERVTTAVKIHGINPGSSVTIRVGEFGQEMEIEHMKIKEGVMGPRIILQVKVPGN